MTLDDILKLQPYSLNRDEKHCMLNQRLRDLTILHYNACDEYRGIIDAEGLDIGNLPDYELLPALPVRLFKDMELRSCPIEEVVKTLTSSGTTGQRVSRIYLNRQAAANQTKCLARIVSQFLGAKRLPMLILDTSEVVKNRAMFSARGAGILGFSMFGSKHKYAFDADMQLDIEGVTSFLEEHRDSEIFLFGFTFMIWQHFYKKLLETGYRPDLSRGILIHGGGWKKLESERVSHREFGERLYSACGILPSNVHDYYGMVEQTGTIYIQCSEGHLHAPVYSDIIIRDPFDFSLAPVGSKGIIQVVSVLPTSYPGHILLTEDQGVILGEDDCKCGLKGKYFRIDGRIKNAEIRGCSDTYASRF